MVGAELQIYTEHALTVSPVPVHFPSDPIYFKQVAAVPVYN